MNRTLSKLNAFVDILIRFSALLGGMTIVFLLISICFSVFMRYFLHRPIGWVVQVSEYCVVFVAFLGAAWLEKKDKHIRVELLIASLNSKTRALFDLITSSIAAMTCLFLMYYGGIVVADLYSRHVLSVDILEVPMAPFVALIPIGLLLLFTQLLKRVGLCWNQWKAEGTSKSGPGLRR